MVRREEMGSYFNCPKGGVLSSPQKRWERVEACLKAHNIDFDMVQSESSAGVDRLVRMMIGNGYRTIVIFGRRLGT